MKKAITRIVRLYFIGCLILFIGKAALTQTLELKGLVSGWVTSNTDSITEPFFGLRYIPEFSMEKSISPDFSYDFQLSLNAYGTAHVHSLRNTETGGKIDFYRMWGRFSSSQFLSLNGPVPLGLRHHSIPDFTLSLSTTTATG